MTADQTNNDAVQADDSIPCEIRENDFDKVLAMVKPIVEAIDPNWNMFTIGRTETRFNGPKCGNVDISRAVLSAVPGEILERIIPNEEAGMRYYNPAHQIQAIPERTYILFENCEQGVVTKADGENFEVEMLGFEVFGTLCAHNPGETRSYTLTQLKDELTWDAMECQAVEVLYFPLENGDGSPMTLADRRVAFAEATLRQEEENRARQAEAERQRAAEEARYAALSPAEKQREDEAKQRKAARQKLYADLCSLISH